MQFDGAIVEEQGVIFAIVVVKPSVIQTHANTKRARMSFEAIADFEGLPLILAAQDGNGRFTYQGRPDIVKFLASVDPSRIPWTGYEIA